MYTQELPEVLYTTTKVKIKYDCCNIEREMKWVDANKNFTKNNGKHICKKCGSSGENNPACRPEVQAKIKATIEQKYGGVLPMNQGENLENKKRMFKDPEFLRKRQEKTVATSIRRYGAEHHMKTEHGKQTQREAMIAKYGVEHPLQSPEVVAKMLQTIKDKHGVENVMQIPDVVEKQQQTTLERFGVRHYNELSEMKDYLRDNCKEWLAESYANPWAKGITRPEEWNKKQRDAVRKRMEEGRWTGGYKSNTRGKFPAWKCKKSFPAFLSSLELIVHYWLNNNPNVEQYDYEGLSIEYIKPSDQKIHLYFPDFQIKYFNDEVIHILETKTYKDKDNRDVLAKQNAAFDFCDKNNMRYSIFFDEDVKALIEESFESVKSFPGIIWQ